MSGIPHIEIHESVEELKQLMNQQSTVRAYKRVHALYLLKSGHCQHVQQVASQLGHDRSTIHSWLHHYAKGGLNHLLDPGKTRGRKHAISGEVESKLKQRLQQPRGFSSYREVQQWLASECAVEVNYHVVRRHVRERLKAKLKVPRPLNPKQDEEEVEQFVYTLEQQIERLATHFPQTYPLRYWCEDESRFGLKTIQQRRITLMGVQPIVLNQWRFESLWLYGLVEPCSGEQFMWEFSHLDSVCFEQYLQMFSEQYDQQCHLIQVDNSGAHTAKGLTLPDNIQLLFQPPYAPELNPIERLWKFIKARLSNRQWYDLDHLATEVEYQLRHLSHRVVTSLCGWDYILDAISVVGF